MKIFIVNSGSSSIKCSLYDFGKTPSLKDKPIWKADLEWKNTFDDATLKIETQKGDKLVHNPKEKSAGTAFSSLLNFIFEGKTAVLSSLDEIDIVGHRIVHGGKYFNKSVLIDSNVKKKIALLAELAPLHNKEELERVEILEKLLKNTPQIAAFDTAFHQSIPKEASIYGGPYNWYEKDIRRYGFHGISFQYCLSSASTMIDQDINQLKVLICHLGSGASLCAIKEGKSIDTTMGFTPLEGLIMDTRSGSIDPGILLYLLEKKKKTIQELSDELYHNSGLLGLSNTSSDMRDIIEGVKNNNPQCITAFNVYLHHLNKHIGSMIASLNGLDLLIFTAGIGENSSLLREKVCNTFSFLKLSLDQQKNALTSSENRFISSPDSKIKVLVLHTQEDYEIAKECWTNFSK